MTALQQQKSVIQIQTSLSKRDRKKLVPFKIRTPNQLKVTKILLSSKLKQNIAKSYQVPVAENISIK